MKRILRVVLAGNPNSGKTTIFNNLTGSHQKVANYPGVTVERRTGTCRRGDVTLEITDLPGTYGLTTHALDEQMARDTLIRERPDIVVNVLDASNLERNLYLTVQLMELGLPLVLAFNMSDVAESQGIQFDRAALSRHFDAPIVRLVGHRNEGTDELIAAVIAAVDAPRESPARLLKYRLELADALAAIEPETALDAGLREAFADPLGRLLEPRWFALKLLEEDPVVTAAVTRPELRSVVAQAIERIRDVHGESPAMLLADQRYGYISGACQETVRHTAEIRHTMSDKVDVAVTHPLFGMALFLGLMYLVFNLTFTLGEPLMQILERAFRLLSDGILAVWPSGRWGALRSLVVDGVIAGVGGVLVFTPNIMLLFFGISLLEYSGYMARAAFLLDRLMHRIGLHGKSFIPMLLGFGCTVPGILATRTLDSERNRLITILILPFMSCGARLTIYALLIPAFFPPAWYAPMLWFVYLTGIVLAVVGARVLGITVLPGETQGMVMELPPYRMPTMRSVWIHVWERTWLYIRKAATIILGISVLLWALTAYPKLPEDPVQSPAEQRAAQMAQSYAGRLGHWMEPVLKPMGFDWRIGTALIGAMAAKEVVVAQLGVAFAVEGDAEGTGSDSIRSALRANYSPLTGLSLLLFCLIGFPCAATVAAVRAETGRWKWALGQFVVLTLLAWIICTVVYQVGSFILNLVR